jgi:putative transposase
MARATRVEFAGACYHVMARGNDGKVIFRGETDRELFLQTVGEMLERFAVDLMAYVLMPNHFHLLLRTPAGNLSQSVGWLQTTYTIRSNRKNGRSGHLFQGRYKAQVVEADAYATSLIHYLHLNPIRTRTKKGIKVIGDEDDLRAYRWSSHLDYLGERKKEGFPLCWDWLHYWGRTPSEARKHYHKSIQSMIRAGKIDDPWDNLKGQLVLGGQDFLQKVIRMIEGEEDSTKAEWVQEQAQISRQKLVREQVAQEEDNRWQIWLRVKLGGERPIDLARELGYRDGGTILQIIKRLEKKAETDESWGQKLRRYKQELSRVENRPQF